MIVMKPHPSQDLLMATFESIKGIIDRRLSPHYLVPFELHEVSEAMRQVYLDPLYWSDERSSFRRLKRLSSLLLEWDVLSDRRPNWQLRLLHLVARFIQKCCFKPKTIPGTKRRRVGGSSYFSAARLNLRNAP